MMHSTLAFLSILAPLFVSAAPLDQAASALEERTTFPFSRVVAFGDNLSDNGNGSVAHGVADPGHPENTIYGYRTWTDGPIAVSYLSSMLGVPLAIDYAFGHADGGSLFGATINNSYTQSTAGAPDAFEQLANYSTSADYKEEIADTLHFLWIGANDINLYHIWVGEGMDNINVDFADAMAKQTAELVQTLVNDGAEHILVPNLYPKNISPSSEFYVSTTAEMEKFTSAIELANAAILQALLPFGSKVIHYDVYQSMSYLYNHHMKHDISHIDGQFCDGFSQEDWNLCVTDGEGKTFYWMQYLDMTTAVHKLIAKDMYKAVVAHFA